MAPNSDQNMSEYERLRLKNIESNKKMLESLGLMRSISGIRHPASTTFHRKPRPAVKRKLDGISTDAKIIVKDENQSYVRRSLRKKGTTTELVSLSYEDSPRPSYKPKVKRENYFGASSGIPVGMLWESRIECSADGVHRPTVAGICGNETDGCYSIALSGGYEDDIDLGESFTYTGSGGRDLKGTKNKPKNLRTAPQSKDQTLTKMNLALSRNVETRQPVRVIRGYKCPSVFAPEYGYRYDGLYTVEKYWSCIGLSGFLVWKYILKRITDQPPPPWTEGTESDDDKNDNETKPVNDSDDPTAEEELCNAVEKTDQTVEKAPCDGVEKTDQTAEEHANGTETTDEIRES